MKTAADIIDKWQPDMGTELTDAQYHYLKIAINEARKECIEECVKEFDKYQFPTMQTMYDIRSLIKELK